MVYIIFMPAEHKEYLLVLVQKELEPATPNERHDRKEYRLRESLLARRRLRYWLKKEGILDRVQLGRPSVFNLIPCACREEVIPILESFPGIKAVAPADAPMGPIK